MTIYYVGPGGSDANDGLSWANRKLTLNGAEDIPVVAGDTVYVGPGVYREALTIDVSGSSGNPITYIGDMTGEHTDGVGGVVRITGSNDDTTATRVNALSIAADRSYRTFRGFVIDTTSAQPITFGANTCTNWILQDCLFLGNSGNNAAIYTSAGHLCTGMVIERCVFMHGYRFGIDWQGSEGNANLTIRNCLLVGLNRGLNVVVTGGITITHCTFFGCANAVRVQTALTGGYTVAVNNCIVHGNGGVSLQATATGEIVENYNNFYANNSDRSNTNTGANSNTYATLITMPFLVGGYQFPAKLLAPSQWSALRAIAGTSMASEDIYGLSRPSTDAKKSWGAVQYQPLNRETTTKRSGTASIKLSDAGRHQIFVPHDGTSTTFSVYVYREANYAGTLPQMIVKQPGQADTTVTDTGSAATWNQLTTTLTPASAPGYVVVELVSNNTATSGSYAIYFDDLTVS